MAWTATAACGGRGLHLEVASHAGSEGPLCDEHRIKLSTRQGLADSLWTGHNSSPFGVAVDESGIYVAANTTENIETCLLKMTPDGKSRLWSALHPKAWDGALSLAVDGGQLFMLGHTADTDGRLTLPSANWFMSTMPQRGC